MAGIEMLLRIFILSILACGIEADLNTLDVPNFDGRGLEQFVTRPELRPPRYVVKKNKPEAISEGYWFVAPYTSFDVTPTDLKRDHTPFQSGAHIYDGNGCLVWSGASKYYNRHVFGFQPIQVGGVTKLSFSLDELKYGNGTTENKTAIILNDGYDEEYRLTHRHSKNIDLHEFGPQQDGQTAILGWTWDEYVNATSVQQGKRRVRNEGFGILSLQNNVITQPWNPFEHNITISETVDESGRNATKCPTWDYFHLNSVDATPDGDHILSARHTNTIYRLSGKTGDIIWRLGGNQSTFSLGAGVEFKWQHDARLISQNSTHTVISLLDNAAEDDKRNLAIVRGVSSAKYILLDHKTNHASLIRHLQRPDQGVSVKMGNVQTLSRSNFQTSNVFVGWAMQGYITEFDGNDQPVLEARFTSQRMHTYRAFKAPWTGRPRHPPDQAILPHTTGRRGNDTATSFYASWNGATEVSHWIFYASTAGGDGKLRRVGTTRKRCFETSWVWLSNDGPAVSAQVKAVAADGKVLGMSEVVYMRRPEDETDGFRAYDPMSDFVGDSGDGLDVLLHEKESRWQGMPTGTGWEQGSLNLKVLALSPVLIALVILVKLVVGHKKKKKTWFREVFPSRLRLLSRDMSTT